jgi:peptide/nickel transport system permease protein
MKEANPQPPGYKHWLGTDKEGRDVFVRMIYGTRISMAIGVVAVSIYVTIGIILGSMAGYFGGRADLWISRFIEVMICFPSFFLILTVVSFIEKKSIFHIMIVIGITSWTGVARLVRAEFLKLKNMDYVQAAIALGMSKTRIMFGHILPNAMGPVLVSATFGIASSILTESSLAFLGLGDPSAPSWGGLLNVGREEGKLWLILAPGIAIFFVVFIFNLVGEALRDALDPRLRQ